MDRAIRVCRSHGFVSTAKESIIFDMAKKKAENICMLVSN
nr:MAG TPA: hypothetical protein [Caudoviricetes sp.]